MFVTLLFLKGVLKELSQFDSKREKGIEIAPTPAAEATWVHHLHPKTQFPMRIYLDTL